MAKNSAKIKLFSSLPSILLQSQKTIHTVWLKVNNIVNDTHKNKNSEVNLEPHRQSIINVLRDYENIKHDENVTHCPAKIL